MPSTFAYGPISVAHICVSACEISEGIASLHLYQLFIHLPASVHFDLSPSLRNVILARSPCAFWDQYKDNLSQTIVDDFWSCY